MANLNSRFDMEAEKTLDHASIGAGYTPIGSATEYPATQVIIQNLTNANLKFTWDDTSIDKITLLSNAALTIDIGTNKQSTERCTLPTGTIFYVKQDEAPTTGSVYVHVAYNK